MHVSPIEESESLSQSGETEKADEGEKEVEVSKDAMDEEGEKEEENMGGRRSVGRKSPKERTKVEKEEHERTHCPYRSWCEHCPGKSKEPSSQKAGAGGAAGGGEGAQSAFRLLLHEQGGRRSMQEPAVGDGG